MQAKDNTVRTHVTLDGSPVSGATVKVTLTKPNPDISGYATYIGGGDYDVNLGNSPYDGHWFNGDPVRVDVTYGGYYGEDTGVINMAMGYTYFEINITSTPNRVYVDDDFNSSTSGWQYDHFDVIQDGIDAVAENGTVYVYNGIYYEHITVNKGINLIGEDRNGTIIDGSGSGHIITISVSGVVVKGFTITNAGASNYIAGIRISGSDSITIKNNIIYDCAWCMYLTGSSNNDISYNYFEYSSSGDERIRMDNNCNNNWFHNNTLSHVGIRTLYNCDYNIWENNYFKEGAGVGFNPDGHYNIIRYNYFDNSWASTSQRSHYNEVYGNNFVNGSYYYITDRQASYGNIVYHNNFIDSTADIKFSGNYMYNSSLQEGNYWSDYTGIDSNGDGIGDTPYTVLGVAGAQDLYPLMHPWSYTETTVSIENATARYNEVVIIPIIIETIDTDGIGSATINLSYDSSVVIVQSIVGDDLGDVTANIDNVNGKVSMVAAIGSSPGPTGTVYFANVTLKAVGSYGDMSALNITVVSLYDGTAGDPQSIQPDAVNDGTFTIIGREGDVNQDGKIDSADLQLAKQHIVGTITLTGGMFEAGDVYPISTQGDGVIDNNDADLIAEHIVGLTIIPS